MSLITRCPACGTMFKVVPDQLRISEGWVRCGHCSEVFDASLNMQRDEPPAATAPLPMEPMAQMEPLVALPPDPAPAPHVEAFDPYVDVDPQPYEAAVTAALQPESVASDLPSSPLSATAADRDALDVMGDVAPVESLESLQPEAVAETPDADLRDVSFVRQARRKAFWRRPGVRVVLGLLGLLLALLLGLQVAVQERDRIAALEPSLKSLLDALCEPLACKVGPLRQIEAIVMDSSSFTKLRGDAYRLNFTLKNQAPTAIAMPAIELTLTDTQDQPLLRRILLPSDMGAKSPVIEGSSDWSGSLALAVAGNGGPRVAGYRVLAFYP